MQRWRVPAAMAALCFGWPGQAHAAQVPETVTFASRDGKTQLTGYLYQPQAPGPHPALVLLHGRSGAYSSLKRGTYTAETLSQRHRMWGNFWAERGYVALLVDSFGPRGYPEGFPVSSYKSRPPEVSEQTVRPFDAYGALDFLRARGDVIRNRIGVHGWSNGGMTILAALGMNAPGLVDPTPANGFRAALAQYPSCREQQRQGDYRPYAPLLMLVAADDDEVSPRICQEFAAVLKSHGASVELVTYEGAQHAYDDPGKTKQSRDGNRRALEDTLRRAEAFFSRHLRF